MSKLKLLIAGSRHIEVHNQFIQGILFQLELDDWRNLEIVHGGAKGIDSCADNFANTWGLNKKVFPYKSELGKSGGPARNKEMAKYADELILIWNGISNGSRNMKEEMMKLGKPVYEIILNVY